MFKPVLAFSIAIFFTGAALADTAPKFDPQATAYVAQVSKLASQGDAAAEFCEAEMYGIGLGVKQDLSKQYALESEAAKKGDLGAKVAVAKGYVWGIGVAKEPKKGADMLRALVAKGYPGAKSALGNLYLAGIGVEKDPAKGVDLMTSAAEADDFEAEVRLGLTYHWGDGVKADPAKAQRWLDKAARHKSACAADYFFELPFIVDAYLVSNFDASKESYGKMGIRFVNQDGRAADIVVFQPSGDQKVDAAWVEAASKAKLPPWPASYHGQDKTSGFWVRGTYDGLDPAFTTAIRSAIDAAKSFPKDVLVNGSKGTGKVIVSFNYRDGTVSDEKVTTSSDEPSEDAAALAAVADAKYPPPPAQYKGMKIPMTITVNFAKTEPTRSAATATAPAASTHG